MSPLLFSLPGRRIRSEGQRGGRPWPPQQRSLAPLIGSPRRAREVRAPESMEFLIFEDNGGDYHWTIVAADGATLARSGSFASYDDAERAAQHVRDGAASARFERRVTGAPPVDLTARRDATRDAATPSVGWMRAAASAARRWRNGQRHADRAAEAARAATRARSKTDIQLPRVRARPARVRTRAPPGVLRAR